MSGPNPALMQAYGTDRFYKANLEKRAQMPGIMGVAGPLATLAWMQADQAHQERQMTEAAILNEMFRQEEARRQESVIAGLSGASPALSSSGQAAQNLRQMMAYQAMMGLMNKQGSAEWASHLGQTLAGRVSADGMDKEAIGLTGIKTFGQGLKGLFTGGATRRLTQAAIQGGAAPASMVTKAMTSAPQRAFQAVGRGVERMGQGLQRGVQQGAQKVRGLGAPKVPAAAAPAAPKAVARSVAPAVAPAAAAAAPAAASAVPAAAAKPGQSALGKAWQAVKPGWKTKALIGAGALGTGYVGLKGLQAARDYMMMPTYSSQAWGGYGMAPAAQVGPYGYNPWST